MYRQNRQPYPNALFYITFLTGINSDFLGNYKLYSPSWHKSNKSDCIDTREFSLKSHPKDPLVFFIIAERQAMKQIVSYFCILISAAWNRTFSLQADILPEATESRNYEPTEPWGFEATEPRNLGATDQQSHGTTGPRSPWTTGPRMR